MAGQSLGQLAHKVELVAKELDGGNMRQRLGRVGEQSEGDIDAAVRGTLGDQSMSGWKRGDPVQIVGTHKVLSDIELYIGPGRATGLMRVLQDGRGAYAAGDRRSTGSYTSKKTGVTRQKSRKVKRTTGATRGKGTWDDAANTLAAKVPARVAKEVNRALGKHLRGG